MKKLATFTALAAICTVTSTAYGTGALNFRVPLSGDEEVPPVATDTTGMALLRVDREQTEIRYRLTIRDATDILAVAGAHLHCAPAGQNGPVVAFLAGQSAGGYDGTVEMRATLTDANITNVACGATVAELVQSMLAGQVYVNVHSTANPGGEVRGQVE